MLCVVFVAGTIVQSLTARQANSPELVLLPGATIEAEIAADSADVHAPKLDQRPGIHPVCSKSVAVPVETSGTYTIELHSWDFDPYLVLRDADGAVLAEDNDGWMNLHARIVRDLDAGRVYAVDVVGVRGEFGTFSLKLSQGSTSPTALAVQQADLHTGIEHLQRNLDDNIPKSEILASRAHRVGRVCIDQGRFREGEQWFRRAVAIREQVLGTEHADTATSANNVGAALARQGRHAESEEWYRRALTIRERVLGPEHADTATSVNHVGTALWRQGRYAESEEWYRRALAIREKVLGSEHADTAASVNNVGAALERLGRYAEAEERHRRALSIREKVLGVEHADTAISATNVGIALERQGRYDESEQWFRRALTIREKVLGLEHADTAWSVNFVGIALERQGRYAESEQWFRRALTIREKVLGPEHADTAMTVSNVGASLERQGRYTESEEWQRRALTIREKVLGPEHPDTAWNMNDVGVALLQQGRYAEAEEWCRRALAIREKVLGPEHAATASSVNSVGVALWRQGRYAEAEEWCRRAFAIREKVLGHEHRDTAWSVENVGVLLERQGRYAESEEWHRRAMALRANALGPEHAETTWSMNSVGTLLERQGRYAESEEWHRRALAIREKVLGLEHPDTAKGMNLIGATLERQGRYAEAKEWFRRALAIREKVLGQEHPDTSDSHALLARLAARQGRLDEARNESRISLRNQLDRAWTETFYTPSDLRLLGLGLLRSALFQSITLELGDASAIQGDTYACLTAWKGLAFRAERLSMSTRGRDADAIERLRVRARDLTSQLSVLAYSHDVQDAAQHRARIKSLQEDRRSVERQLFQALAVQPERERTDAAELGAILPTRAAIIDFIEFTPYRFARPDDPPADDGDWLPARMHAWLTRTGATQPVLVDLGSSSELERLVDGALAALAPALRGSGLRGVQPAGGAVVAKDAMKRLHEALWQPLQPHLKGINRLIICPDACLAELPFEALTSDDQTFLIERVDVAYEQDPVSLRELLESEPFSRNGSLDLLAVGDVDYGARAESAHEPLLAANAATSTRGVRTFSRRFEPLPETKLEVNGVADIVRSLDESVDQGDGASDESVRSGDTMVRSKDTSERANHTRASNSESVLLLTLSNATEEKFKSAASKKRLLHLATHGFYQRDGVTSLWAAAMEASKSHARQSLGIGVQPGVGGTRVMPSISPDAVAPGLLTGLALAGVNASAVEGRDDGVLTADEVARLDLSACDLAVLSACETALGQANPGEGLMSLRRAFLQAGARTVISTLWRVDDRATRELMGEFYRRLLVDKQPPGAALRGAKLHLLKNTEFKEPRYWAAFTLAGDWR